MLWIIVGSLAKGSKDRKTAKMAQRGNRRPGLTGGRRIARKINRKQRQKSADIWQQSPPMISLQVTD
ncbi:MAG: hypothetical protein JO278_01390 [Dyella sp.]|nr:hypothetical protein [Dyella sp.]